MAWPKYGDFLQFQEFANVYEELNRGEKRKTSPTKSDEESPTSKIKSEPLSLQENVFNPAEFEKSSIAFENESIMIKSEPSLSDFTLDLKNLTIPPLPPVDYNIKPLGSSLSMASVSDDLGGINPVLILESERQFSNSMSDACTHLCRLCGKSVTVTGMRNHTRTSHGIAISAYTAQFGNYREKMEKVMWHKCGLCAKVFLLDGDEIHKHCNSHRIMMAEYTKMFIVNNYVSSRRQQPRNPQPSFKIVKVKTEDSVNSMILKNEKSNFDITTSHVTTLDLGSTKTIGTIKIKKESLQLGTAAPVDIKPSYKLVKSLPKAAPAGPPGPPAPPGPPGPPKLPAPPKQPKADVFGTINEIEDILAMMPDSL